MLDHCEAINLILEKGRPKTVRLGSNRLTGKYTQRIIKNTAEILAKAIEINEKLESSPNLF